MSHSSPLFHFVDGYHGGIYYGVPPGTWRDIVSAIEKNPDWKVTFDVEPSTWEAARRTDPDSFQKLAALMNDSSAHSRLEVTAGSFAQPYGWAFDGESNLRHLVRGRQILSEMFPSLVVDTYATQEPNWTSCLPQMLRELGFKRAVLRDPGTAFAGTTRGIDAEAFLWQGPDGTTIPAVSRYACEELVRSWETESRYASFEFLQKCLAAGIAHPSGTGLQDLGWRARPEAPFKATATTPRDHVRFTTWREFFETVIPPPSLSIRIVQEDFQVALPFGDAPLSEIAAHVRSAEIALRQAETLAALAAWTAQSPYPFKPLQEAGDLLMLAQHHDSWICARWRAGRENFAWIVASYTAHVERIACTLREQALDILSPKLSAARTLTLFNTLPHSRQELVEVAIDIPPERTVAVYDAAGRLLPIQLRHDQPQGHFDHYLNAHGARLITHVEVPALGSTTVSIKEVDSSDTVAGASVRTDNGMVKIETRGYTATLDPTRGGAIASFFDRHLKRDICPVADAQNLAPGPHVFRAFLASQNQHVWSTQFPATITPLETGPLRIVLQISGHLGPVPFISLVSFLNDSPLIDCTTTLDFGTGTEIGDPEGEPDPAMIMAPPRQAWHDDHFKLLALFPTSLRRDTLTKDAAWDICQSTQTDTRFNAWNGLRHRIILNWIDAFDSAADAGLALFTDRTTAYYQTPSDPLGLVLAYGRGPSQLRGKQTRRFAFHIHSGDWQNANLWAAHARWRNPMLVRITHGSPGSCVHLTLDPPCLESTWFGIEQDALIVRVFNASTRPITARVTPTRPILRAQHVTPLGSLLSESDLEIVNNTVILPMRPLSFATLRLS